METEMESSHNQNQNQNKAKVERGSSLNQTRVERRRRIVERGSDRLNLITGGFRSLSTSTTTFNPVTDSSSSSSSSSPSPLHLSSPLHLHAGSRIDETLPSTLPTLDECTRSYSTREDAVRATLLNAIAEDMSNTQPLLVTSTVQGASTDTNPPRGSRGSCRPKLFTHRQLNSCIAASEKTRAFCALLIAILVVLSHSSYPLFGRKILASRPLYIVLLTNVAIALTRLFLEKQRSLKKPPEQERYEGQEDGDILTDAVDLLQSGLVVYRILNAVLIDCSIYLVVVVCGLSLV